LSPMHRARRRRPRPLWNSHRPRPRRGALLSSRSVPRQHFSTQFVDVTCGQLLDVVEGRSGKEPKAWLEKKGEVFRNGVVYATSTSLGLSAVLDEMLPAPTQVADRSRREARQHQARRVPRRTRTRRSAIADGATTPSIAADGSSRWRTSDSRPTAGRSSSACCALATRR